VTALARRGAGKIAVSCESLTKVVNSNVSIPPCDQTTWLNLCAALENVKFFDPEIVRVRSALPTRAFPGEIEMFADGLPEEFGPGDCLRVPPPQANCHKIRNPKAIHEKHLGMTSSTPGDIGGRGSQLRLARKMRQNSKRVNQPRIILISHSSL